MPSDGTTEGDGEKPSPSRSRTATVVHSKPISLSEVAARVHLGNQSLKETIATRILNLFSTSLIGTLSFAGALVLIDAAFILLKVITPEQRLVTEKILMTFVTATVLQVGAAIAAIVFAVFKDARDNETAVKQPTPQTPTDREGS